MSQRQGGWKRIASGHYVYRNAAGHALAYVMRYGHRWVSEIRKGTKFVETGVSARTMKEAQSETETAYRDSRTAGERAEKENDMPVQPDARGKVYRREDDGATDYITVWEALRIMNGLMMARKLPAGVKAVSSSRGRHVLELADGGRVLLTEVDASEMPAEAPEAPEEHWSTAGYRPLLHLFTAPDASGRAVCNKSYRPWLYGNGYSFRTRAEVAASKHADMYTFCPRCERKQKQR